MKLLPGLEDILGNFRASRSTGAELEGIKAVTTAGHLEACLASLQQMPLAAISLEALARSGRSQLLRNGTLWQDIRSQVPTHLIVTACVLEANKPVLTPYVLDLSNSEIIRRLSELFRLRVPFLAHGMKSVLFAAWTLDPMLEPRNIYDTEIASAAIHLGKHHARSFVFKDAITAKRLAQHERSYLLSQTGQVNLYAGREGVDMSLSTPARAASPEIASAAERSAMTFLVYRAQQMDLFRLGLYHHLHAIEFPFVVANARVEWNGVFISKETAERLIAVCTTAIPILEAKLRQHGVTDPKNQEQCLNALSAYGLIERNKAMVISRDNLKDLRALHPVAYALYYHLRCQEVLQEGWLHGLFDGADGRIHPRHVQLGASTGRNTCGAPNLAGIGRNFRPVLAAPEGRVLLELDYSQIEVGVAAGESDDSDLIRAYNSGDVYASVAQRFYNRSLSKEELALSADDFKKARPELRDRMKPFVLGVIYNIMPSTLARQFGITKQQAEEEIAHFLDLFPVLKRALESDVLYGRLRGYAYTISGLRRHVPRDCKESRWVENFLRNTPIQGSAAVVFKRAVVALNRAFSGTSTKIVMLVHDAVVIECDQDRLDDVAQLSKRIMGLALSEIYPKLIPKVEVNMSAPWCWNKDGRADSIEKFITDITTKGDTP